MAFSTRLKSLGIDIYMVLLIGMVVLATLLPARGFGAEVVSKASYFAVMLLFFLYGAKLNTSAIVAGISNWRLQLLVFAFTFIAFPLLGLLASTALGSVLQPEIVMGLLYLSLLPSTVQSSIAFTSIAGGNVPAAVCAASVSNLLGVFITPALTALLLHTGGHGVDASAMLSIGVQILLPFFLGQMARPLIGPWVQKHKLLTSIVDRGSILLIVYSAFSAGMVAGIWSQVDWVAILILMLISSLLLAVVMIGTVYVGKACGLSQEDRLVLLFCGSKKSLASGLPMANILFAGQAVSLIILPVMIFHQIQLLVCAVIAQRIANGRKAMVARVEPKASAA
ncbi:MULTISPECIES: bile acid:sodium symporter family protein [unclassified Devosia]|uniref:bile acid:sodium symporter family protein n=1 Tax=unclassified Devosia TaxID=196773 RepID=UPI0015569477|nr:MULTISPECIES: bile acid:sodium symporter family protein [unclassified Devosia]